MLVHIIEIKSCARICLRLVYDHTSTKPMCRTQHNVDTNRRVQFRWKLSMWLSPRHNAQDSG